MRFEAVMRFLSPILNYTDGVVSDADVQQHVWSTCLWLDADSGDLVQMDVPSGEHAGNTVETWLSALHFADIRGSFASRHSVRSRRDQAPTRRNS